MAILGFDRKSPTFDPHLLTTKHDGVVERRVAMTLELAMASYARGLHVLFDGVPLLPTGHLWAEVYHYAPLCKRARLPSSKAKRPLSRCTAVVKRDGTFRHHFVQRE